MRCNTFKSTKSGCKVPSAKKSLTCVVCMAPIAQTFNLDELMHCYRSCYQQHKIDEILFFRNMKSFDEALEFAEFAYNSEGRTYPHQYRLKHVARKEAWWALQAMKEELQACANFYELYQCIVQRLLKVTGVGPLYYFDTALRLGAKLGHLPEHVIVQCGSREGAQKLGLKVIKGRVDISQLPLKLVEEMNPWEIENFLCIYRSRFDRKVFSSGKS